MRTKVDYNVKQVGGWAEFNARLVRRIDYSTVHLKLDTASEQLCSGRRGMTSIIFLKRVHVANF